MKQTPFRALGIVLCVALLAVSGSSSAIQEGQDVPQPKLQYDVRVALKLIQVSVVDKSGKPVTDLKREEFELSDNGKPVSFEVFEKKIFGPRPGAAGDPEPESGISRKFFIVFDLGMTRPRGVALGRATALRFLDEVVQPSDEVALVTYSAVAGMRVHEYLTTESRRIRDRINRLQSGNMGTDPGRAESLAKYWVTQERQSPQNVGGRVGGDSDEYQYSSTYGDDAANRDKKIDILNQSVAFCEQLRTMAKSLRYVPGNKNIVLFSDGIPRALLYGKMAAAPTMSADSGSLSARDILQVPQRAFVETYKGMMKEFKTANCPVFAIDTSARRSGGDIEDAYGLPEDSTYGARDLTGSGTLREISDTTGGRYLGFADSPEKAFETVRNLMGAIYVLGYPVKDTWDGKYHKIKVKVRRKGCDVVAQAGFYNPKPYSEYSKDDKLFQLMDLALSDNPQFLSSGGDLPFVAFPVSAQGVTLAAGIARIPGENSVEELGKDTETFLLILNDKNDIQSIVTFDFGGRKPAKGGLDTRFVLPMKPGRYVLRLVVRNKITGWGARGNASLNIPRAADAAPLVDPPLLLLAAPDVATAEGTPKMPLSSLYPCVEAGYVPALGGIPAGTAALRMAIRLSASVTGADVRITGTLTPEGRLDASELDVKLLSDEQDGAVRMLCFEFPCAGLAPGTYNAVFEIGENEGLERETVSVTFRIEP